MERLRHKSFLAGTAEIELLLEMHISHQFFFREVFTSGHEAIDFGGLIRQKIGDCNFARIGRGEYFNSRDVTKFAPEDRASATVANVGYHAVGLRLDAISTIKIPRGRLIHAHAASPFLCRR